ncbi:hypothetical protein MXB_1511 [Myxobolus squamalis]|nr:hypothetical protein MXB_1511 [Myxobolus squamalis]
MKTETNIPEFNETNFKVTRRFREFHALYESLVDKYRELGYHIPHPPEKSVTTSTKVKTTNTDLTENTVIEQRRCALENFMGRIMREPIFVNDQLSSIKPRDNLIKLKQNISSTLFAFIPNSNEYDKWYEEKVEFINNLEVGLQRLHYVALDLHYCRKGIENLLTPELVFYTKKFATSLAELRSTENEESVANALGGIVDLKQRAVMIYDDQCINDIHELVGTTKDYLDDLISVKHLLETYAKKFTEVKQLSGKIDKLKEKEQKLSSTLTANEVVSLTPQITEMEKTHSYMHKNLEEFYDQMKASVDKFEKNHILDTRASYLRYLIVWQNTQEEV